MRSDQPGGTWVPVILAALALLVGFVGLVLIDLRDDVLIGEDLDTGAGILGGVCVLAAGILLVTALLWNPVRRRRALPGGRASASLRGHPRIGGTSDADLDGLLRPDMDPVWDDVSGHVDGLAITGTFRVVTHAVMRARYGTVDARAIDALRSAPIRS